MTISIRPAREEEAALLTDLALRSKAHWGYDPEFLASCREELTLRSTELAARRTAVAAHHGRIVGFTTFEGEPPRGVLGMMFVDPDVIGQGIGRMLFNQVAQTAKVLGFTEFTIDADPNAEPFYEAMGGVAVGRVPSGSIPGRTLTQYLRSLPS
ncbi:GNAT family N-acetyltransferase [Streptomyces sp. MAI_2237]